MEQAAITVHDLSLLARCEPLSWDPLSIFERLIPRREIYLKRNLIHASDLQQFSRAHPDDGGTCYTKREMGPRRGGGGAVASAFDIALGAKDTAPVSVVSRPMYDLSGHVARNMREFLTNYPMRFNQIDFSRFRMSKLMAMLLKHHVKDYVGDQLAAVAGDGADGGVGDGGGDASSQYSSSGGSNVRAPAAVQAVLNHALAKSQQQKQQSTNPLVSSSTAAGSDYQSSASISSSVARAITGTAPAIKFGPPVELLSSSPLSVHLLPYGRNCFFPELMERRRQLEQQMQLDPDGWRAVVLPPKLVAAVLRFFVVVLNVPPRVVLQRLGEVLPAAVQMHYELSAEEETVDGSNKTSSSSSPSSSSVTVKYGGVVIPIVKVNSALSAHANGRPEDDDTGNLSVYEQYKKQKLDAATRYPANAECGLGIRYYATTQAAATAMVQRAHMLSCDALLILHYTPHPVFGDKHESPLVRAARAAASRQGMPIVEKVNLVQQQELLQVLGILAKKHPHVYICYEEVNATGGTLSPDVRLVLTRVANTKFTLLVDGTFSVANPCAAPTKHWLNSARNAPGTACADAYLIGCGAYLPTVNGRGAAVVYSATKCAIDVEQVNEDPMLPLLIDDAVVLHHEMVRVMGPAELATEITRAANGIAEDAKKQLAGTVAVVRGAIVCIPVPHLGRAREASLGRAARRSVNVATLLDANVARSLERAGVTCAFLKVNLHAVQLQNAAGTAAALAESVGAEQTEQGAVFCAVMFPHLQTIEQVSWQSVWTALAGGRIDHPQLAPTLSPPLTDDEIADKRLIEKMRKQAQREYDLKRMKEDPNYVPAGDATTAASPATDNKKNSNNSKSLLSSTTPTSSPRQRTDLAAAAAADAKQEEEDIDMLNMIRDIMGGKNANPTAAAAAGILATIESGDIELLARDPYSYASRLDNVLARYEPMRAGSARAMMDARLEEAEKAGFFGFKYNPEASAALARSRAARNERGDVPDGDDPLLHLTPETIVHHILRREVVEAVFLGQMVLHYGKEPTTNGFFLITQVIRDFMPDQIEKLPVLIEAYAAQAAASAAASAGEQHLLDLLVEKYVPPHKRGLYRSRQMYFRAPYSPDVDVALTRRMVHKCLTAHRRDRIHEVSSIAHLLAPLATLIRQGTAANVVQLHKMLLEDHQRKRDISGGGGGGGNGVHHTFYGCSGEEVATGGGGFSSSSSTQRHAAADFFREEETAGKLVRRVLEEEIGIIPRVIGVSVMERADSPFFKTGGATPAISALIGVVGDLLPAPGTSPTRAGSESAPLMFASSLSSSPSRSVSAFVGGNHGSSFLGRLFGTDDRIIPRQNHNFEFGLQGTPGARMISHNNLFNRDYDNHDDEATPDEREIARRRFAEARSASLVMSAAAAAEAVQDRQQEWDAERRRQMQQQQQHGAGASIVADIADPYLGHTPRRLYRDPPSTKERVIRIYASYEPAKLPNVDKLMREWAGREEILVQSLCAKYGPEPPFDTPIQSFTRMQHFADPAVERPATMANVMRGFYQTAIGPSARHAIDDGLDAMYPIEETAARIHRKIHQNLQLEMKKDV